VIAISPIILAFVLGEIFWRLWVRYIRSKFLFGLKYALLEIKLPKETFKSPLAMETFFHSIHNTASGSEFAQYWKGEMRPSYSLEIISVEGRVKFFVWTEDRRKGGVISALYSQYPNIEIYEREDYTRSVHFDPKIMKLWGEEFKFTKDDPYPIKTYVDYGLDEDPKEEYKVDPLVPILEFLGSVGPNQQVWFQFIIRAHKKEQRKPGHLFKKTDLWHDRAEELVNEIMKRDAKSKVTGEAPKKTGKDEKEIFPRMPTLSSGEKDIIDAIERSVSKLAFDVGVRALYIAKKESFNSVFGIGGIIGGMKQFSTEHLNGFKPRDMWHGKLNDPWMDFKNVRRNRFSKEALDAYKLRSYFYPPVDRGKCLVLNTEELATMFHFPGQGVAATPTLERVPSKKSQAPSNLPI
jgi:hypothetical protein